MNTSAKNAQALFLNRFPADDLNQQIFGKSAVIAASAAVPGLAGEIFRKGGQAFHTRSQYSNQTVIMIAKECDMDILNQ